jgi:hypothetical protein
MPKEEGTTDHSASRHRRGANFIKGTSKNTTSARLCESESWQLGSRVGRMGQFGFFDADRRLVAITAKGDPLVSLIGCYVVQLSQVFMLRVFPVGTNY